MHLTLVSLQPMMDLLSALVIPALTEETRRDLAKK